MNVKRPMLWISASFVAGIFSLAFFGVGTTIAISLVAPCVFLFLAMKKRDVRIFLWLFVVLTMFILGFVRYSVSDDLTQKPLNPFVGKTGTVTGEVLSSTVINEKAVRFSVNAESFQTKEQKKMTVSGKIYLTVYFKDGELPSVLAERGDVISADCEISIPDGAFNRGGFDYNRYLKTKGVFFAAYANEISIDSHREKPVLDAYYSFRERLIRLFDETFPKDEASLLKAYILGDQTNAERSVLDSFSQSGLSHVLAISGMHVSVFLSLLTVVLKFLRVSKRKQLVLSIFMVIFFVIFTGAPVSAIRAGLISVLLIGAQLFYRRSDPAVALSEAAALICAIEPHLILSASFQLSFGAALGILLFSEGIKERITRPFKTLKFKNKRLYHAINSCLELLAIGLSAQVFIVPIMVYQFQTVSLSSVIATLVITPLLAPVLAGGLLFCAVGLIGKGIALPFAGFVFFCSKLMLFVAKLFAEVPFSSVSFGRITPFLLLLYTLFIFIIIFSFFRKNRTGWILSVSSFLSLVLILFGNHMINREVLRLSFINIGQGDCALIKSSENCDILIDAGGKEGNNTISADTVRTYLLQNGIQDVEYAVVSHGHVDHIGGMLSLVDMIEIKHFIVPEGFGTTPEAEELLQKLSQKNIPVFKIKSGDVYDFQNGLTLSCLLPDKMINQFLGEENENNRSAIIKFQYGNTTMLFTGDAEKDVLEYLGENYGEKLSADILKVPHHGAKTSTSELFLTNVNPTYAVIPVGKNNYGHPHKEVLHMLAKENVVTFRTDLNRDVTFYIDTEKIKGIVTDETGVLK